MTARRAVSVAVPMAAAVVCGALYVALSLIRFGRMEVASYDNAIFEEAIRGYAGGGWPIVPIKGPGFNLLGDHFSPAIATIAPFYRLFPHAETLLVAQAALIAVSVFVVASVGVRALGVGWGSVVAVAYGLSFGLQSGVVAGFHEVALGVPLLALAGGAFVERRYSAVIGWSLPLLLVKEDLGLTVAAVGGALFLVGERRRGMMLAGIGAAATAVVVLVLIPWARGDDSGYAYSLGGDGLLATLADEPGRKALTVLLTLAVGGIVAVASPWVLVAVPTLAWRFAADNPYYWGTDWHYSLLLMPVMAMAAIDVMQRIVWVRPVALAGMAIVTTLAIVPNSVVASPLVHYLSPDALQPTEREQAGERVLDLIPAGATVESDIGLINHLVADGRVVTWIGTDPPLPGPSGAAGGAPSVDRAPEWIVLDHDPASNIGSPPDAVEFAEQRHGVEYETVLQADPFQVARRASP
ncbi:MAG TPA: DUF2079 domain-containing protein [Aeromicrobium sp.]|nr:DUF2079 domain-containing protein [Aeromicrobium sp.]HKY57013.1 DUF2079 domain-containing protein [Aeromicrobium sp.]